MFVFVLEKIGKRKGCRGSRDDDGNDDGGGEEGALACGVSEEALRCRDGAPGFHDRRLRERVAAIDWGASAHHASLPAASGPQPCCCLLSSAGIGATRLPRPVRIGAH